MELDYKALGKRIKIARINADMTQNRLSTMLEMSPSHMSNIETGSTRISLTALVSIANALGVTVDDLLYDSIVHARPQLERDIQQAGQRKAPARPMKKALLFLDGYRRASLCA